MSRSFDTVVMRDCGLFIGFNFQLTFRFSLLEEVFGVYDYEQVKLLEFSGNLVVESLRELFVPEGVPLNFAPLVDFLGVDILENFESEVEFLEVVLFHTLLFQN